MKSQRVVFKLGTGVVMDQVGGLARTRLTRFLSDVKRVWEEGREVVIVSSGAVGAGRLQLGWKHKLSLEEKQACAAVGQGHLISFYQEVLASLGIVSAQLLLTARELAHRTTYLNLRKTFETLLKARVIPIVNENDPVSTSELAMRHQDQSFGDNDKLSALVSAKIMADLLVILTQVDGIYAKDPSVSSSQVLPIPSISNLHELSKVKVGTQSQTGRGGARTKLEAARIASISGVKVIVASGLKEGIVQDLFYTERHEGTHILPQVKLVGGRKTWIGFSCGFSGVLKVNEGAKRAMTERNSSLLPVGVVGVEGDFSRGQVVSIQDEGAQEIGRGIVLFHRSEVEKIMGSRSEKVREILGVDIEEVVHRDDLVLFGDNHEQ